MRPPTRSRRSRCSTASGRRSATTASGSQMGAQGLLGLLAQHDRGAPARARRLPKAACRGRSDRGAGVALPAAAGVRLGRGRGRSRAGGDRPEVQPAVRPGHPGRLRAAAAIRHDHADPGRHRRHAEDEQVAGELRGRDRSSGGDVRPAHAGPRRGDGRVLPAAARGGAWGSAPPTRQSAGWDGASSSAFTMRTPPSAPRSISTACSCATRRPTSSRRSGCPRSWARTASSVHLPLLMAEAFGMSSSEARRLLQQGGVKLDGEALDGTELDLDPGRLDGRVLQVGKRRFRRLRATA